VEHGCPGPVAAENSIWASSPLAAGVRRDFIYAELVALSAVRGCLRPRPPARRSRRAPPRRTRHGAVHDAPTAYLV